MEGEMDLLADQPLGQKLIKKWFWLYFFSFLVAPAGYIIKVIISNSVSVADVGVLYSIVWLITFLNVYNDLWLTESLQYFLPRYRIKKQYNYIKTSIYISLVAQIFTAIIIATILRFWAPRLAEHYFHSENATTILKYFCFYFLWINLFQILQSIFIAFQDTFRYQLVDFIKMRSIVGFTFFFFITGKQSIERYSLNRLLGLGVGIIIALIFFQRKYASSILKGKMTYDKPMIKEYVKYALRCFLWMNVWALFWQIIQQLVIVILWAEAAWYYTNFISLFIIPGTIIWPIIGLIFPLVAELINKQDTKKLSSLYSFFYTYFTVFSIFLAIFFGVLGKEIALILFGQKFILSWAMFNRWAIITIFTTFVAFNFAVLAWMGKIRERIKILVYSTLSVLIVSIIWLYTIWIYWSVLALWISYLLLFYLSIRLIYRNIKFSVDKRFIVKNMIIGIILGITLLLIKNQIFTINNESRYKNLIYLCILWIGFLWTFIFINRKKYIVLKKEIYTLKKAS